MIETLLQPLNASAIILWLVVAMVIVTLRVTWTHRATIPPSRLLVVTAFLCSALATALSLSAFIFIRGQAAVNVTWVSVISLNTAALILLVTHLVYVMKPRRRG